MSLAVEMPAVHAEVPAPRNCADLEALHRDFYTRLVRVCAQQLRDRTLAEDVAQDTILRALRFWSSYDAERPTWPWLKRIALHLCNDAQRARSHEVCLDSLPDRAETTDRTERLIDQITVRGAMADLPERQALALQLRYFDDRDRDASAEALGVNVNAFDQLLNRARMRLARVIEPARAGSPLGLVLIPLRWLRRRRLSRNLGGGGTASTLALGAATTIPLAIAPLLAIVAGMAPGPAGAVYPAARAGAADLTQQKPAHPGAHASRRYAAHPAAVATHTVRVAAGPAVATAKVSKHPFGRGRIESYRVQVATPAGIVAVWGESDRDPQYDTLCQLPGVQCSAH